MRSPRIGDERRSAASSRAARRALELDQNKVIEACFQQSMRRRESRDSSAYDDHFHPLPLVLRRSYGQAVAQPVTDRV